MLLTFKFMLTCCTSITTTTTTAENINSNATTLLTFQHTYVRIVRLIGLFLGLTFVIVFLSHLDDQRVPDTLGNNIFTNEYFRQS